MIDFSNLRRSFSNDEVTLKKELLNENPIEECISWLHDVKKSDILDGNAMTLSTSTKEGDVTARIVLLKYLDERGFVFFTNYNSRKSKDLSDNPKAALTFYWASLNRQICINGIVEKLALEESEKYFRSRPRLNQLLATASNQDEEIDSIEEVLKRIEKIDAKYKDEPLPTPKNWGGFRLKPHKIEFWQGGQGRVNLRFAYNLVNEKWQLQQLSP